MLGGISPVLIFQFSKKVPATAVGPVEPSFLSKIPVISDIPTLVEAPPIPIYLDEGITGLLVDSEEKHVDIETDTETKTDGSAPTVNQKAIASTVSIQFTGKKDSIKMILLSAMIDVVFEKVTSQEYALSYLSGATTVFRGVLHSYGVSQNSSNDLVTIKLEISKGTKNPVKPNPIPTVPGLTGTLPGG